MKKPWEKGFIPKPGARPQWQGPKLPEGWRRHDSTDAIRFERYAGFWSTDLIVGRPGCKWSLWFDHSPGVFRAPDMKMNSLEGLLAWYMVESEAREPATYHGTRTARSKAFAMGYGGSWQTPQVQAAAKATQEEARRLVEEYRAQGYKVDTFMDEMVIEPMETSPLFADYAALEDQVCKTLAK